MMVAAIQDYLFTWQLPLILLFIIAWLVAGPFLTRRALAKIADLPRNKSRLANAARINFLAQGLAMGALALVTGALALLGSKQGMPWLFPLAPVAGLAVWSYPLTMPTSSGAKTTTTGSPRWKRRFPSSRGSSRSRSTSTTAPRRLPNDTG